MPSVVFLSDTHMWHDRIEVARCDLLVHCGDFTRRGSRDETLLFLGWLGRQDVGQRILCAGNHDHYAEREPDAMRALAAEHDVTYLVNEETTAAGLRVWGSPVTPRFRDMAFNVDRGAKIRRVWDAIPTGLDLLFTHGPPKGLGDRTFFGGRVGCADLRDIVFERAPRVHAFGHIHEDAGAFDAREAPDTRFLNVASRRLVFGTRGPVRLTL